MRNHFEGRKHSYKAICFCPVCDKETRRRVSQFWSLPPEEQKEVAVISPGGESIADAAPQITYREAFLLP
jgi:hypothetical protein